MVLIKPYRTHNVHGVNVQPQNLVSWMRFSPFLLVRTSLTCYWYNLILEDEAGCITKIKIPILMPKRLCASLVIAEEVAWRKKIRSLRPSSIHKILQGKHRYIIFYLTTLFIHLIQMNILYKNWEIFPCI
jgi:hypothetical protein